MQLHLLKAKIHRASVTHAELHYEGSCAIDGRLLDLAGIREYEQIHIYNVNNGARFVTYAIPSPAGSREIAPNGACAHLCQEGDLLIIAAFRQRPLQDVHERGHEARVLILQDGHGVPELVHQHLTTDGDDFEFVSRPASATGSGK